MPEFLKYAIWMLSPLGLWCMAVGLAWFGLLGRRRLKGVVLGLAHVQLLMFSTPWVADSLLGGLESEALRMQQARSLQAPVDAIVILGGGLDTAYAGVRDLPDLQEAADRVWVGANLYKQGVAARVLVSGGGFSQDRQVELEAIGMSRFLQDLGVPSQAILKEMKSRTTLENAWQTRQVLEALGPSAGKAPLRVALVTSAFHMPRALPLFEQAGLTVYPVRADIRVTPEHRPVWRRLPGPEALAHSTIAIKEYLGRLQTVVFKQFREGGR